MCVCVYTHYTEYGKQMLDNFAYASQNLTEVLDGCCFDGLLILFFIVVERNTMLIYS